MEECIKTLSALNVNVDNIKRSVENIACQEITSFRSLNVAMPIVNSSQIPILGTVN